MAMQINKIKRKLAKNKHVEADMFDVHDIIEYGFPSSPSAIAFDELLGLLALASGNGEVRIYGKSGVILNGKHDKSVSSVLQLEWIPNEGRLISLSLQSGKSVLTMFEINVKKDVTVLESVKEVVIENKRATTCCLMQSHNALLIGTEVGDTLVLDVTSFTLQDDTIHIDVAMQSVPEDLKLNPGPVKSIQCHPTDANLVLIGFGSGLLVIWNLEDKIARMTFYSSAATLESICWLKNGTNFMTSHADGSHLKWTTDVEVKPDRVFPFDDPREDSKSIPKVAVCYPDGEQEMMVFSGGLPKQTYASVHSLTVKQGEKQVNYEIASKVVDFIIINEVQVSAEASEENQEQESPEEECSKDDVEKTFTVVSKKASALAVLTEEELLMIDLQSEETEDSKTPLWPAFRKPYLNSASPNDVTCLYIYEDCGADFVAKLRQLGSALFEQNSPRDWPVFGGSVEAKEEREKLNVAVTGHYNGSVRFYDVNCGKFELLYTLSLSNYFMPEDLDEEPAAQESLGEFDLRKVGEEFGSCGDDNRFAVCKLYVCPKTEKVYVGSHSGQVIVFHQAESYTEEVPSHEVKIVPDEAGFKWKGAHPAKLKDLSSETLPSGYLLSMVVQCEPPAPITAMAVNYKNDLIAVGTSHGFGVFDCATSKTVLTRSTLVENDEAASGAKLSKSKSLREGIRNSFRRLKPKKAEPGESPSKAPAATVETKEEKKEDETEKQEEKKEEQKDAEETKEEQPVASDEGDQKEEEKKEVESSAEADGAGDAKPAEEKPDEEKPNEEEKVAEPEAAPAEDKAGEPEASSSEPVAVPTVTIVEPDEHKTTNVGRVVESRGEKADKTMMSTIRYLFFADTFLRNSKDHSPSLWIGTHSGSVYSYLVTVPAEDRETSEATLRLAKEIKLLHRAPVVYMNVLDHSGFPLPDSAAVVAQKVTPSPPYPVELDQ